MLHLNESVQCPELFGPVEMSDLVKKYAENMQSWSSGWVDMLTDTCAEGSPAVAAEDPESGESSEETEG